MATETGEAEPPPGEGEEPEEELGEMVNEIEIELLCLEKLPSTWSALIAESGESPLFADHLFGYEAEVTVSGTDADFVRCSFTSGRLLGVPYGTALLNPPVEPPAEPENAEEAAAEPQQPGVFWVRNDAEPPPAPAAAPAAQAQGVKKGVKDTPVTAATPAASTPQQTQEASEGPKHIANIGLTEAQVEQLERAMDEGMVIQVAIRRVLGPKAAADWEDPNEQRYRGIAKLPLAPFSEPGVSEWLYGDAAVRPVDEDEGATAAAAGDKKGKKPPAKKPGKGATGPPDFLLKEEEPTDTHPYVSAGTQARVKVSFKQPLVCLPEKRPRPPVRINDMIRRRLRHHRRSADAVAQYHQRATAVAESLVQDFLQLRGGATVCTEEARKDFLQYIGSSGKHRKELREVIVKLVREHHGKSHGESAESLEQFYDELYVFVVEETHRALSKVFQREQEAPEEEGSATEAKWARLAQEAEVVQEFGLAARYHQERLARGPAPGCGDENTLADMWTDYARYCLRSRQATKAEEAFREAVSVAAGQPEPTHLPSLLGLGLLLTSRDRFEEAEVCLQTAVDAGLKDPLSWACLALCHERAALAAGQDALARRCRKNAKYARLFAGEGADLLLVHYTLELWLEDLTEHCLGNVAGNNTPELQLLRGKMYFQLREVDGAGGARDWLENKLLASEPNHMEALLLLGDVYVSLGETEIELVGTDGTQRRLPAMIAAEEYYDRALRIDEAGAPGPVYVRLGNIYNSLGRYEDARDTFLLGAREWPSGLCWMGLGISYYRLGDMRRAEQALSESNLLNNLNPRTWAYLCLVCLRQKPTRAEDADFCLTQALRLDLSEPDLLTEIGIEQQHSGRLHESESAFLRSLRLKETSSTRLLLAGSLTAMRRFSEARSHLQRVANESQKGAEKARAEKELAALAGLNDS